MSSISNIVKSEYSAVWKLSLLCFLIAGFTGVAYRYGLLGPLPEWLLLGNIRHAHSHLMFFNWITPPILVWMAASVVSPENRAGIKQFRICLYTMMAFGALSWPFFLLYGYRPVAIGSASLPVAAILSGMVMLTWYWFAVLCYRYKLKSDERVSIQLFEGALLALLISSIGAWGVSLFQFSDIESPVLSSALTHFFLAVFTEGWAVLGFLGMIWSVIESTKDTLKLPVWVLWKPILLGATLVFPWSLPETMVPPVLLITGKAGFLLIVFSTAINLFFFMRSRVIRGFLWNVVLVFLGIKALMMLVSIIPLGIWPGEHGLQILYLHILMLGIVSPALIDLIYPDSFSAAKSAFTVAVIFLILSLVMISGYWPNTLLPGQPFYIVFTIALLPLLPAGWIWWKSLMHK